MDPVEKRVRAEHPDWTDEQVATELARLKKPAPPKDDPPAPKDDDQDRDAAMARMRRDKEKAEAEAKAAKEALAAKERAEAEAQGQWETLAKQYETERDEARVELADFKARIEVEKRARAKKFRAEDEAIALLKVKQPDLDYTDTSAVDQALQVLADERPHLINQGAPPPGGAPVGGPPPGGLTREQVEAMSPAEMDERWAEVQAFLATQ